MKRTRSLSSALSLVLAASGGLAVSTVTVMGCDGLGVFDTASSFSGGMSAPSNEDAGVGLGTAPTGQRWAEVETDTGCGRKGLAYVLVDEVCGIHGDGYDVPALQAPMFRDGVLVGDSLLSVDATFLWSLDLAEPNGIARKALLGGIGEPTAAAAHGASEVLLASGAEGLVRIDATNPSAPSRTGRVELPGFAHDVDVDGDTAYVALGRRGIGIVDLVSGSLTGTIDVPGYSVGVKTRDGKAYVAACNALTVVDIATKSVVGQAWSPNATNNGILVGPAKDVELVGDTAFVAAGRLGVVAVDITTPEAPRVRGNCTEPEPSFYASGVRAGGTRLFVAGGEWGVLPIDVATPSNACNATYPASAALPSPGDSCSGDAPWELLGWEELWAPPPPRKDPIQVLPVGDRLFAFGDARRIGTRAVDVRNASDPALGLTDRYDEPQALLDVGSSGDRLVTVGPRGGVFAIAPSGELTRIQSAGESTLRDATTVGFTTGGLWVTDGAAALHVEGQATPLTGAMFDVHDIVGTSASEVAVATKTGLTIVDVVTNQRRALITPTAHLPVAIAVDPLGVYAGAPEWTESVRVDFSGKNFTRLPPHGIFGPAEAESTLLWQMRLPRRYIVATNFGVAEIAGVGPNVGLAVHGTTGDKHVALPPAVYAGAATDGTRVYAVGIDRSTYRSTLVTVSLVGDAPTVVGSHVFTGGAVGITVANGHAYIATGDGEIRVYALGDTPALTSIVKAEETP